MSALITVRGKNLIMKILPGDLRYKVDILKYLLNQSLSVLNQKFPIEKLKIQEREHSTRDDLYFFLVKITPINQIPIEKLKI